MPWSPQQRIAIFLSTRAKKGEQAARSLMHRHGYYSGQHGGKKKPRRKSEGSRTNQ